MLAAKCVETFLLIHFSILINFGHKTSLDRKVVFMSTIAPNQEAVANAIVAELVAGLDITEEDFGFNHPGQTNFCFMLCVAIMKMHRLVHVYLH